MSSKKIKLAIWLGFPTKISLKREGIFLYLQNLLGGLLDSTNIEIELWLFHVNYDDIEKWYSTLPNHYKNKVKIYFLNNFLDRSHTILWQLIKILFYTLFRGCNLSWRAAYSHYANLYFISINKGILYKTNALMLLAMGFACKAAYKLIFRHLNFPAKKNLNISSMCYKSIDKSSRADLFLIPIITLNNAKFIPRKKIVIMHDLFPIKYKDLFQLHINNINEYNAQILQDVNDFQKSNTFFLSHCEHIRTQHILKFTNVAKEDTDFVYLPANAPGEINNQNFIIDKEALFSKFNINNKYIIYPTQIRPYKNVIILLKALRILNKKDQICLLLTGDPSSYKPVDDYIKTHNLYSKIILTGNISTQELYSLYHHSEVAVIPTLEEGGFPWQALEGLLMSTPVILSDIPVVKERLEWIQADINKSELLFFEPHDYQTLADMISLVLNNRDHYIKAQKPIASKLLEYDWKEAALQYYQIFNKILN